jgi:exodeoxyribonuclease V alpha subunit
MQKPISSTLSRQNRRDRRDMQTELSGQIEHITYFNEENGFTIAKVKVDGRRDPVTVRGILMGPLPGEVLTMQGEWTHHPKYGEQFRVVDYRTAVPASVYGIQKYLGSGLIKGIGPVMARRIVKNFGKKTLEIIEEEPERLAEIEGIGNKRIVMIKAAWDAQREIRDVMLFLQGHDVSSGYSAKIFKAYGNTAIQVVRNNPYRLASDIFGIGFLIADRIAEKMGFDKNSPLRAQAGILYVLNQLAEEGSVYTPYEPLITRCIEVLHVDRDILTEVIGKLAFNEKIVIEDLNDSIETFQENFKAVFLAKYYLAENRIAERMARLSSAPKSIRPIDTDKAIEWVQGRLTFMLAEKQIHAIRCGLDNKVMIITGGPGTGKTTIINAILKIYTELTVKTLLAAPTGRAAKKMTEATGHEAKTIHRLLEYSLQKGGFKKDEADPLDCDVLFIDEASMIDTLLMHYLMKAVPPAATLIIVGDVNQLPSVGAGNVLHDLIESEIIPIVRLNEIFRQAKASQIVINAHRINNGKLPLIKADELVAPESDFYFINQEDPEKVLQIILELVSQRIPRRFGYDSTDDIQVLAPMHKGIVGTGNLNIELQGLLNPGNISISRGDRNFRIRDKVMQIRNNYEKEVYNGDIGRIAGIDPETQTVSIGFDKRQVDYEYSHLDEIVLAYAVSVHKSQGSEYPVVVLPVLTQHYLLLQRNLIYTAVTRGRKLVVLVGTWKALAMGVRNDKMRRRYTHLRQRLIELKEASLPFRGVE